MPVLTEARLLLCPRRVTSVRWECTADLGNWFDNVIFMQIRHGCSWLDHDYTQFRGSETKGFSCFSDKRLMINRFPWHQEALTRMQSTQEQSAVSLLWSWEMRHQSPSLSDHFWMSHILKSVDCNGSNFLHRTVSVIKPVCYFKHLSPKIHSRWD